MRKDALWIVRVAGDAAVQGFPILRVLCLTKHPSYIRCPFNLEHLPARPTYDQNFPWPGLRKLYQHFSVPGYLCRRQDSLLFVAGFVRRSTHGMRGECNESLQCRCSVLTLAMITLQIAIYVANAAIFRRLQKTINLDWILSCGFCTLCS